MREIEKKILEAFKRSMDLPDPVDDTIIDYSEYGWEYDSLEEALMDYTSSESINESLRGDQLKQFNIGDIVMTKFYSPQSKKVVSDPHRILVITSKKESDGVVHYRGFVLSSKVEKSNKKGGYPNTLYIKNYSSILDDDSEGARYDKEAVLLVHDLIKFNSKDHSMSGTYKGHASSEFLNFVQKAYHNYRSGKDNSQMYWE